MIVGRSIGPIGAGNRMLSYGVKLSLVCVLEPYLVALAACLMGGVGACLYLFCLGPGFVPWLVVLAVLHLPLCAWLGLLIRTGFSRVMLTECIIYAYIYSVYAYFTVPVF